MSRLDEHRREKAGGAHLVSAAAPDPAPAAAWEFKRTHPPERRAPHVQPEVPSLPTVTRLEAARVAAAGLVRMLPDKTVLSPGTLPAAVEQYRKLAATLHHTQVERHIRSVLLASAVAGEGKTLTATNLALTLSESYRRQVLLIDADLRRPSLHELFQISNSWGLSDSLKMEERRARLIQVTPRLLVLPAGKPDQDPMSGLTSERMRSLLTEAAMRFDWIIIDTPPVGLLSDANLLAAMVDVCVLVVAAGRTPQPLVQRAVDALGRERVLGVVLNLAEERALSGGYSYYSYYGYYRSYGSYGSRSQTARP